MKKISDQTAWLIGNGGIYHYHEVADALQLNRETVGGELRKMVRSGLVERTGCGYYRFKLRIAA